MEPKTLEYVREAFKLFATVQELAALAVSTLSRIEQAAHSEITDADLDALKTQRHAAVDRLAKSVR